MTLSSNTSLRSLTLTGLAGFGLSLLSALPAAAHGSADASALGGALHPLLGLDHLLLLVGVGLTASRFGAGVLAFALGGALLGGVFGSLGGHLPAAEVLAALAVSAVGLGLLMAQRSGTRLPWLGGLVAGAVAIHATLHGQESAGTALWWLGALAASIAVTGISLLVGTQLNRRWGLVAAAALMLAGGALAIAPL
jgi:urease accessory protein